VLGAYLIIVLIMVVAVELALGGASFRESTIAVLAAAGLVSVVSAVLAGYVGTWIVGRAPRWHALAMTAVIGFDTAWIVVRGIATDPVWFTIASGLLLCAGLATGAELRRRKMLRAPSHA
jgi:ABC-type iron transport system FetAB permease component